MINRNETHITDTLAVREVISKIPENWLIRNLEERDYGIDLKLELFDGQNPTGMFSIAQIKGTKKEFCDRIVLSGFPSRTLEYALLFPEPFFIFYVSVSDKKTYFVWAQKYEEVKLSRDNPDWRKQSSISIEFPEENVLGDTIAIRKMEYIMNNLAVRTSGLEFVWDYERLKMNWDLAKTGDPDVLEVCVKIIDKIRLHTNFLKRYDISNFNFDDVHNKLQELILSPIEDMNELSIDDALKLSKIDMSIMLLEAMKYSFLSQSDSDKWQEKISKAPF